MADGITNVPQVSMAPEPVSQMYQPPLPVIDVNKFKTFDQLIDSILEGAAKLTVTAAGKSLTLAMDAASNVSDRVMSAAQNPMDSNFVSASASPEVSRGAEIEAPGRGMGLARDGAPSMGSAPLAQSKSPVVAQVSNAELGNLTPVNFGVGQQNSSQGIRMA